MPYLGVEFTEEAGGGLALVHQDWITPRKTAVWWPPYKQQFLFNKALQKGEYPEEKSWTLYNIGRVYFQEDNYETARKKLKLCENTSDIPTDIEQDNSSRKRKPTQRFLDSDDSDDNSGRENAPAVSTISRPPRFKQQLVSLQNNENVEIIGTNSTIINSEGSISNVCYASPSLKEKPSEETFSIQGASKEQFWRILVEIREQNKQILANTKVSDLPGGNLIEVPRDIPVEFPLDDVNNVKLLETFLENNNNAVGLASYLSTLGGRDVTTKTNRILRKLITNNLATKFSFHGTRANKLPFAKLNLNSLIIDAVKRTTLNATNKDIEDSIKVWLKHSPKRVKQELLSTTRANK